jgi:hypothetical protein
VSEVIFGLFMALIFVGVVSMATADREDVRAMLIAALGCNLAWGLVDALKTPSSGLRPRYWCRLCRWRSP